MASASLYRRLARTPRLRPLLALAFGAEHTGGVAAAARRG
jgi:hypothetical protein